MGSLWLLLYNNKEVYIMSFNDLIKDAKGRLDGILVSMLGKSSFKLMEYSKRISPFELVRTERLVRLVELAEKKEKKDEKIISEFAEIKKLLAELVKNTKPAATKKK